LKVLQVNEGIRQGGPALPNVVVAHRGNLQCMGGDRIPTHHRNLPNILPLKQGTSAGLFSSR
jgi:hypothetical protein